MTIKLTQAAVSRLSEDHPAGTQIYDSEAKGLRLVVGKRGISYKHVGRIPERLKQVNCHIPSEVIQEKWRAVLQQAWSSEAEAYQMEQRVLGALAPFRTQGERAQCSEQELKSAWMVGIGAN